MGITYTAVEPDQVDEALIAGIREVHREAFAGSIVGVEYPAENVASALPAETHEPGFHLHCARDDEERVVGFAYGYVLFHEPPAGGWSERLADAVGDDRYGWLDRTFGFAWFAVRPSAQGRGIGSTLHDRLLASVPCDRAWLVCPAHETALRAFYRHRGWVHLATSDLGTGTDRVVMGLDLPKRRFATAPEAARVSRSRR
jgi:GNAT superfamily N-acetyltransferase